MRKTLLYSALILLSALFIAPFYWTFMTAIKSQADLYQFPPVFWPSEWHWENFAIAWTKQPFGMYLTNSLIVVIFSTVGQLLSSSLVAYGFARFRFPGRDPLFILLLATMMIPVQATLVPSFRIVNGLGLIGTFWAVIIPGAAATPHDLPAFAQALRYSDLWPSKRPTWRCAACGCSRSSTSAT